MYVAVTGVGKSRVIQFVEQKRIPKSSKKKTIVVKTIGNYERLLAENPNIIADLKEEAKRLTAQKKASNTPLSVELSNQVVSSPDDFTSSYRFGHALINQFWKKMNLDSFFLSSCGKRNADSIVSSIYGLISHRMCEPLSVSATKRDLENYAGLKSLGKDIYFQALDVLNEQKESMVNHLCDFFSRNTSRIGPQAYYDVTTYAFESQKWGELRMFGFSKDHKNNEVQVVMGLLIDNNGIPITYELFPGNTMDQKTLKKAVERLKEKYALEKIVVVADRGLNGGDNLAFLSESEHDFVISYTLKRAPEELKKMALDDSGWVDTEIDKKTGEILFRQKIVPHTFEIKIPLTEEEKATQAKKRGRPKKNKILKLKVNIHLTWSAKRAAKDYADRNRVIEKLKEQLDKPSQIKSSLKRGRNQYIAVDIDTKDCHLDEDRIASQERFDGYYAVVTNNLEYTTNEVCEIYGGLWKIEESFSVLKSDLQARPVYVWSDKHIHGHFALCFLSLCIIRYAQYLLKENNKEVVSASKLMNTFNSPTVMVLGEYPVCVATPTGISQTYLDLADIFQLPSLRQNMTLTQFKTATKLDLNVNLK